ncbi:MAG: hypothetical protein A3F73_08890 [Gallionellales bacterium RIFCSPLOWO2_12_FULL_59_22]|nr:MAG: hypothetical protein A2Z65_06605 [Gallionellales bacterium RIFCSPLOWO2_02_58_13]OGT12629.1 MAG: hypothetical protein A3F73_08890 [Gallionellales bacterium RIFCSPLOWO2_12_FULL_59_22]
MRPPSQRGFTLVEMIMVITITGIIGSMVAMFIRAPVQGYVDSARRAEMTDIADTALRRLGRDLRTAVPNSVRVPNPTYIEFLPTKDGGRYRARPTGGAGGCAAAAGNTLGDALNFDDADSCFEIIGTGIALFRGADDEHSDQIIVGSTQSDGNLPYIATAAGVRRPYTGATGTQTAIRIAQVQFPVFAELEGRRFEVVPGEQQAVTYACLNLDVDANGDGTGTLTRFWSYGFNAAQAAPAALAAPSSAILADKVSACSFVYDPNNQRNSLVAATLTLTRGNESVRLYHEIHVNNIP